jgi:hypothetical protein
VRQGIGAGVRKAGDPGLVEKIANFLGDNAYTRAWHDAVLSPVVASERALISDPAVLRGLAAEAAGLRLAAEVKQPGEYLGTALAKEFSGLTGIPEDFDIGSAEAFARPEGYRAAIQGNLADAFDGASPDGMKRVLEWAQRNPAARKPLSAPGGAVALGLGNPAAAYGIPAAGLGLGVWAAHDVLLAQQQAEKESQLPMSASEQRIVA